MIKKINKVKFVATTTEGRKINVVYIGNSQSRARVHRAILNRLQTKYNVHPSKIEQLIQQEPQG